MPRAQSLGGNDAARKGRIVAALSLRAGAAMLQELAAPCRTSRSRLATIRSSPGRNIHTPTTIVLVPPSRPALAGGPPVEGLSSMRGVPWRIFCIASAPLLLTLL